VDFFRETTFRPLVVLALKFLHAIQPPKLHFQSDLGRREPQVALPDISTLRFIKSEPLCIFAITFYRAMHFSAKRGIAIACRLSVRLSVRLPVCDVGEL